MKTLFLGLGGVGQRHLRNLLLLDKEAEIGAVRHTGRRFEIGYNLEADRSIDIEEKYNIKLFADLTSAMEWNPELAVISTPTSAHLPATMDLVQNGIPVFLEKPISHNNEGVKELVELSKKKSIPVMVGFMLRFHPGVQHLLKLVRDKVVGRFYSVQIQLSSFMPSWHPYENFSEFYVGNKALGGGAILTEIHEIDLLHQMFGMPKKLWCVGGKLSPLDLDVEDTVTTLMEYETDGKPLPVSLNMSFVQRPIGRTITIFCEKGKIHWEMMESKVTLVDAELGKTETFTSDIERNQMFVDELSHFISCIRLGKTPIASIQETFGSHEIALKMKESLENSKIVYF